LGGVGAIGFEAGSQQANVLGVVDGHRGFVALAGGGLHGVEQASARTGRAGIEARILPQQRREKRRTGSWQAGNKAILPAGCRPRLEPPSSYTIPISGNDTAPDTAAANLSLAKNVSVDRATLHGGNAKPVSPEISPGLIRVWSINGASAGKRAEVGAETVAVMA
jgi:hypothetical protein